MVYCIYCSSVCTLCDMVGSKMNNLSTINHAYIHKNHLPRSIEDSASTSSLIIITDIQFYASLLSIRHLISWLDLPTPALRITLGIRSAF